MTDEYHYAKALSELDSEGRDAALYSKAFVLAAGNSDLQRLKYVELRVEQLKRLEAEALLSSRVAGVQHGVKTLAKTFGILAGLGLVAVAISFAVFYQPPHVIEPSGEAVTVPLEFEDLPGEEQEIIRGNCFLEKQESVSAWKNCMAAGTRDAVGNRTKTVRR